MGNVIRDMKTIKKKKSQIVWKKTHWMGLTTDWSPWEKKNSKSEDRLIKS